MSEVFNNSEDSSSVGRARTYVGLLVVFAIGAVSIWMAGWIRSNYANPERFYVHSLPPAERTPAISSRVVLVLSDGLRDDVARGLPNLSSLARRPDAAFRRSVTEVPSLSRPGAISILCGSGPVQSGFPLNQSRGVVSVECLFDTVAAAGMTSAVGGVGEGFSERFHPPNTKVFARQRSDDVSAYTPDDFESLQLARNALETDASFVYLYFPDVDEESHLYGALSPRALSAAELLDGYVGEIASSLDFTKDTLIVTSDHGHRDEGGHGGYEWLARHSPLLMVGKGISGGSTADASQADIAPTIAALLGVARPRHAEGMPLLEELDVSPATKQSIHTAHRLALQRKLQSDLEALTGRPASAGEVDLLKKEISEAGWSRGVREAVKRIPWGGLVLAVLAVSIAVARGWRRETLIGGAAAGAIFAFGLWALGWRLTISQFNQPADESRLTWSLLGSAVAGVIAGSLLSARIAGSKGRYDSSFSGRVIATTAVFQGFAGLIASATLVYYGVRYSWRLPDLRLGLATFWSMYGAGFAAVGALALVVVSAIVTGIRSKYSGKKSVDGVVETEEESAKTEKYSDESDEAPDSAERADSPAG